MSPLLTLYDKVIAAWRRRSAAINAYAVTADDAAADRHIADACAAHIEATELQRQLALLPATTPEERHAKMVAAPELARPAIYSALAANPKNLPDEEAHA